MQSKINGAIAISGQGSNMECLLKASLNENYPVSFSLIVSDRNAPGLGRATALIQSLDQSIDHSTGQNWQCLCLNEEDVGLKSKLSRKDLENKLHNALMEHGIDVLCLAGFMPILSESFVCRWEGRILNIHPSLLPAYQGLHTHRRVLADGMTRHGCSVHIVTKDLDAGPILAQTSLAVLASDDDVSLAQRVLREEHHLYPQAVANYVRSKTFRSLPSIFSDTQKG